MKKLTLACATLCLLTVHAFALDRELEELNRIAFQSIDLNGDGMLSLREVDLFRQDAMISQDYDDDGVVTAEEHLPWDMGWQVIAEERGVADQYWKARQRVFDAWDVNGDRALSEAEQTLSQSKDFYAASIHSNMPLNFEEFKSNLRIIAEMNDAVSLSEPVTLINAFSVPAGKEEESIKFWENAAEFLSGQPGYISTALHQTILPDAEFNLINVAKWESVEAYKKASMALRTKSGIKLTDGLIPNASLYKIIRSD